MKRLGVAVDDRRERCDNGIDVEARQRGGLSNEEVAEIRDAYLAGGRGSVLIGLRGEERVMTMLLPPQPDAQSWECQLIKAMSEISRAGCDGSIHVHRVRRRVAGRDALCAAVAIDDSASGLEGRRIVDLQ